MKSVMAIAIAFGLVMASATFVRADEEGVDKRPSDTDLSTSAGAERFFKRIELGGGSGS